MDAESRRRSNVAATEKALKRAQLGSNILILALRGNTRALDLLDRLRDEEDTLISLASHFNIPGLAVQAL